MENKTLNVRLTIVASYKGISILVFQLQGKQSERGGMELTESKVRT